MSGRGAAPNGGIGRGDVVGRGGQAAHRPRAVWTVPCVVAAMVASLFLGEPAGAGRDEARRRAGLPARVVTTATTDPAVNESVPELIGFARALADGRMNDASRIGDRLAADPAAMAVAAGEVGAAQLEGPVRDTVCQLIRTLQAAFAGFPSVTGVFVRLLAAFGCAPGATTSTLVGTTTTAAPGTTSSTGPTTTGPTTTLPPCMPSDSTTTTACIPGSTTTLLGTTTTAQPTTTTTGGPTTTGPTTTLPFCIPNNPVTTTVPCQPLP